MASKIQNGEEDKSEIQGVFESARVRIGERNDVYVVEGVGQGCAWYLKRVGGVVSGFFLHSDNHGQYGEHTNDLPRLRVFLSGCIQV